MKILFTTGYARNAIVHQGRLDPGGAAHNEALFLFRSRRADSRSAGKLVLQRIGGAIAYDVWSPMVRKQTFIDGRTLRLLPGVAVLDEAEQRAGGAGFGAEHGAAGEAFELWAHFAGQDDDPMSGR
jgi:hypothetical protein